MVLSRNNAGEEEMFPAVETCGTVLATEARELPGVSRIRASIDFSHQVER